MAPLAESHGSSAPWGGPHLSWDGWIPAKATGIPPCPDPSCCGGLWASLKRLCGQWRSRVQSCLGPSATGVIEWGFPLRADGVRTPHDTTSSLLTKQVLLRLPQGFQPSFPGKLAWHICYAWFFGRRGNMPPSYLVARPKSWGVAAPLHRLLAEPSFWVSPKLDAFCIKGCRTRHPRAAVPNHPRNAAGRPAMARCGGVRRWVEK